MKVNFEHKGGFTNLEKFLTKSLHIKALVKPILDKYGKRVCQSEYGLYLYACLKCNDAQESSHHVR